MKIGVFDSGLGGLVVTQGLIKELPDYDYLYLGDTARVPYGNRSQKAIYEFTKQAVDFLLKQGCAVVIVACNTASAEALRQLQQSYLPKHFPDRRVLGVLIPAAEAAAEATRGRTGVIATTGTVTSNAYIRELHKLDPHIQIFQQPTPLLVPLIENNAMQYVDPILKDYVAPLIAQKIDTLILGCTHYPILKDKIRHSIGEAVTVIAQDEVVPAKLADYLRRHPEVESRLSRSRKRTFLTTDLTPASSVVATQLFGMSVPLQQVDIAK